MNKDTGFTDNMQTMHRVNRFEVFFNPYDDVKEQRVSLSDILRLNCHSIWGMGLGSDITFNFYDDDKNLVYNALMEYMKPVRGDLLIEIHCFNGQHDKYETISITGDPEFDNSNISFNWASNQPRDLSLVVKNAAVTSHRV